MADIKKIKRYGSSFVLVLDKEFMEFRDLHVDEWVDLSEINKVKPENHNIKEEDNGEFN